MAGPKEFRELARECIRCAGENRDERRRQLFIELAKHWMRAAVISERSITEVEDEASLVPKPGAR